MHINQGIVNCTIIVRYIQICAVVLCCVGETVERALLPSHCHFSPSNYHRHVLHQHHLNRQYDYHRQLSLSLRLNGCLDRKKIKVLKKEIRQT